MLVAFLLGGVVVFGVMAYSGGEFFQGRMFLFEKAPAKDAYVKNLDKKLATNPVNQAVDSLYVTRGQLANLLVNSTGMEGDECPDFADVPADYVYASDICTIVANGYLSVYSDGVFRPDSIVNRAEAAKVMHAVYDLSYGCEIPSLYSDDINDEWYTMYVNQIGINEGFVGDTEFGEDFRPADSLTLESANIWIDNLEAL